ncbi:MAG: hypothetical protein J5666_02020 [Bacilli bacterium]|nr:hypothetical protein [Bacilli bacterium]
MKKIRILSILVLLVSLFALASCEKSYKTSVKYANLKQIAYDAKQFEVSKYQISGKSVSVTETANVQMINCRGSQLGYFAQTGDTTYIIVNLAAGGELSVRSKYNYLRTNDYDFSSGMNGIFASYNLPIVIMETSDAYIKVFDHMGNLLYTSPNAMTENTYIDECYSSKNNHYCLSFTGGVEAEFYFRYTEKDGAYTVTVITEDQFNNPAEAEEEEVENLNKLYNRKGKLFGYYRFDGSQLFLYNTKKNYINNVDVSSFGFDPEECIWLETKVIFYANDQYFEKLVEQSSKTTYKCRTLEVNLKNGKVKYNDNSKYYIEGTHTIWEDVENEQDEDAYKYRSCVVLFNKLNKRGEREDVLRCSILKNRLTYNKSYVYDGFEEAYALDKKTLLVEYEAGYYLVDKKGKQTLNGLNIIGTSGDGSVLVSDTEGEKYAICQISDLAKFAQKPDFKYNSVSYSLYNGKFITIEEKDGEYKYGDVVLDDSYLKLANKGIIVTSSGVAIGNDNVLSFGGKTVKNITQMGSTTNYVFYKVSFSDGTYGYFSYQIEKQK